MKVLHINAGNMYGGVETLLVTLARYRDLSPEMEPAFALCFEGRVSQELRDAGVPVHSLGPVRTSRFWSVIQARQRMRELLREHSFDVVVSHMCWSHAIFGPEVRRAGLPLVHWVHGGPSGRHWLERWASRTPPDLAICNSRFTANAVPRLFNGVPKEVLYLPVAGPLARGTDRSSIRRELGADDDVVVILQASRMEAWKGHELHLNALARLKDVPAWTCWIAGGAQRPEERGYVAQLQRQCAELGISDRVRFLGQRSDVPALMAAADIFCQPNRDPEPFGIVFIEALWAGLPVVSTHTGGAAEIVDANCGVLIPPGDAPALADCLRWLVCSPEVRQRLSSRGPARASALCDPATQLSRLHEALEKTAIKPRGAELLRAHSAEA